MPGLSTATMSFRPHSSGNPARSQYAGLGKARPKGGAISICPLGHYNSQCSMLQYWFPSPNFSRSKVEQLRKTRARAAFPITKRGDVLSDIWDRTCTEPPIYWFPSPGCLEAGALLCGVLFQVSQRTLFIVFLLLQ